MRLIKCFMTQSTWYNRASNNFVPKGILFHSTGANNPYISRYVQPDDDAPNREELLNTLGKNRYGNDWNHIYREAGVNYFIGKLADESIATVQVGPETKQPWGCGGSLNKTHIQFEICEDGLSDKTYFEKVYKEVIELCVDICKRYNINPRSAIYFNGKNVPTITDHAGSYRLGMGSNHSDVGHWFPKFLGPGYLDVIRKDIEEGLKGCDEVGCPYWVNGKCTKETAVSDKIEVGDLVHITGSTYYKGGTIPAWVRNQNWFVYSVGDGVRIVLNENESRTNRIMSPVNVKDLQIVKKKG